MTLADIRWEVSYFLGCHRYVRVPGTDAVLPCSRRRFHPGHHHDSSGEFTEAVPKGTSLEIVFTPLPQDDES